MSVKVPPMNVYGARTFGMLAICAGMLLSSPVYALSLGGIQVKSALDEPLEAEITLKSADAETLESLEVSLGSREDFQRAAVPRSEFLQQLSFSVSSDGDEPVVRITTEQPVKEPFLHFLIAAEWSGGKLVREYTGLLDPPLYTAEAPASVEPPATGGTQGTAEDAMSGASSGDAAQTVDTGTGGVDTSGATVTAGAGRSAEYGPTQEGDTLWDIASKLQTGAVQVNVFQIMIALLRENPEAFVGNNINRLKTNQVLRIEDIGAIAEVPRQEASAMYTAQLEEWRSYKTRIADAGGETRVSDQMAEDTASSATMASGGDQADAAGEAGSETGETMAAESAEVSERDVTQASGQDDDVLRIVQATLDESQQPETAGAGSDRSGEIAELRGQIATLEESLESRNLENQELQERVRLLESQLENAQRLIEIESQELAAAQQQAEERQQDAGASMADEAAAETAADEMAGEEGQTAASGGDGVEETAGSSESDATVASVDSNAGDESAQTEEPAEASTQQAPESSGQQAAATSAANEGASSTQAASQGGEGKVRKVVNRPPQGSWWSSIPDMLFSSWMWMVGAGVGVLVLLLGLLMFLRRRQSIAEFEESILSGSALDSYSETTDSAASAASDTSFLSDFGTPGMGTMQADEVDPLAEAEVYLAYGRDEQAEEVLKEAARRDPERSEIKLKLLEIYKQRNDVKSFETIAEELYPASEQEDPEIWRQVSAMGREISPDNPLFQESEAPAGRTTSPGTTTSPGRAPTPAEEPGQTAPTAATAATETSSGDDFDTLNFDLDDIGTGQSQASAAAETVDQEVENLDLDLEAEPSRPEARAAAAIESESTEEPGDETTLDLGDDFLEQASRNVDPSSQPFPQPDQQTDLDRELERLASERESAPTQVRPAEPAPGNGAEETASREVSWETADSETPTLDFPASDTSEIEFDLNLDESSLPSESSQDTEAAPQASDDATVSTLDTGEGLLEFESDNIPPQETWAGPSSDAAPGSDDNLPYSPTDDVQSTGAPPYNEAETKLDLARAYLDMGDKVGARSIIDEVMREGDPAQRDRAAELASQL